MPEDNDFLDQLNSSQRAAVEYCDGASLVIAGAGSGKTRVLTYKVAYLLKLGYQPWSVLALTFTNKAAGEMKQRIARLVGEERAAYLNMGTFHSIFARILRVEAECVGYQSNYTIYDESDSRTLIKSIIKELGLDDSKYKPAVVHQTISLAKNRLITADMYENDGDALERDRQANLPLIHQVYTIYTQRCRQANAMDFDDLLLYTYLLFRDHDDVRKKYAERFEYVLVDEYQDTNYAQQQIVYQLTAVHQHVCVVGDDAQSIYAFRGANIDNILGFQQLYHDTRLFKLERNYRSTQRIVEAANSLIRHNERQIRKDVYSRNEEGEPLVYLSLYSDKEEVVMVSRRIRDIMAKEHCSYSDFAILYRTNAQSRAFEEQLRKEGIPYRIFGGLSFYQRKEIKDVVAYLRVVANPDDEEAFRRIINYPSRGIGNVTIGKIADAAHLHGINMWRAVAAPSQVGLSLSRAAQTKVAEFMQLIEGYISRRDSEDVFTLGVDIIQSSGIARDLSGDTTPEGISRMENIEELVSHMKDFVESQREEGHPESVYLTDFLQEISLLTDLDSEEEESAEGRVSLMTVHGAKGLEFPTVFIVGMEENIFPSQLAAGSRRELEEERRLLYVAITRAEKHCFLTSAQNRLRYGRMEFNPRSRFINDIDRNYMSIDGAAPSRSPMATRSRPKTNIWDRVSGNGQSAPKARVSPLSGGTPGGQRERSRQDSALPDSNPSSGAGSDLHEGSVIEHQRFGIGTVVRLEGRGENLKATVVFRNAGQKQLLVKFARFKIVR